jgi:trk system potassium uptake protein TrkA
MLSCLIARRIGAKHTIARVRNPIYYQQIDILKEDLRLSMVINPEFAVATEIARNLIVPAASKVETFVKGRIELVEFSIREDNPLIGNKLADIYRKFQIKVLICAIQRGKEVHIPDGEFVIQEGDKLHVAATHKDIEQFFTKIGNRKRPVRNVIICGGGRVGFYLAKKLCSMGMQVKIVEHNHAKCEFLCEELPNATIIYGDATDHDLLLEEGVREADALVALTGVDEENISQMFNLMEGLDLDYVLNSQVLWGTYEGVKNLAIYELIREGSNMVIPIKYSWNGKEKIVNLGE